MQDVRRWNIEEIIANKRKGCKDSAGTEPLQRDQSMKQSELEQLLKSMSLEEKINQMLQVTGDFYLGKTVITGPMRENGFTE